MDGDENDGGWTQIRPWGLRLWRQNDVYLGAGRQRAMNGSTLSKMKIAPQMLLKTKDL
jgi:hypothetical protein